MIFSLGWFVFAPLDNLATIVWIVGVTNAFNLLDNMDGLAAGMALIACSVYFAIAAANSQLSLMERLSPSYHQSLLTEPASPAVDCPAY